MLVTNLTLKNWRNFRHVDVALQKRQFLVGPNASGKSNLLDVFRFLRDIAKQRGGGLQAAIAKRGGMSKLRCLSARKDTEIVVGISLADSEEDKHPKWRYEIGIKQGTSGHRMPYVSREKVWADRDKLILDRPNQDDKTDRARLTQTCLEQVNNNRDFREIAQYLEKISYLHLVPQLLRHADVIRGKVIEDDPFGQGFLESMAKAGPKSLNSRLRRINEIIKIVVPKLKDITFERDPKTGRPHITALYSHWRLHSARQMEDQFSDGTLRLMALIWSLLEGESMLLLEEPELSLHAGVVERLAALLYKAQQRRKKSRQVLISTHSADLLSDKGVGGEEVLMLCPTNEGTKVDVSSEIKNIKALLVAGLSTGEVVIPHTKPKNIEQMSLFNFS